MKGWFYRELIGENLPERVGNDDSGEIFIYRFSDRFAFGVYFQFMVDIPDMKFYRIDINI